MAAARRILIKGVSKEVVVDLIMTNYVIGRQSIYDYQYCEVFLDRMNYAFIVFDSHLDNWVELDLDFYNTIEEHDNFLKIISENYKTTVLLGYSQTTTGDTRFICFQNGEIKRLIYQKSYYNPDRILMETDMGDKSNHEKNFAYPNIGENIEGCKFLDFYSDIQTMFEDYGYKGKLRQKLEDKYIHIEYLNEKSTNAQHRV